MDKRSGSEIEEKDKSSCAALNPEIAMPEPGLKVCDCFLLINTFGKKA